MKVKAYTEFKQQKDGNVGLLVCLGCYNKVPQTRRPKGQKFIISQLCKRRDEVRAQTLKEWHSLRTKHKLIKTKWVQDDRQVDFH